MDGSPLFLLTSATCLLLFFLFRVCLSPYLIYLYYTNRQLYGNRYGVYYFQFFICWAFFLLNYFWFNKLISVVIKKVLGGGKKKE